MIETVTLCPHCMQVIGSARCPSCGAEAHRVSYAAYQLPPETLLHDRYLIGYALGTGGFGITYLALDIQLNQRVAVKEYYPVSFVQRAAESLEVVPQTSEDEAFFQKGIARVREEAGLLASLDGMMAIVRVEDFFLENGTAYIVMEYVQGETLQAHVERGPLPAQAVFDGIRPMLYELYQLHSRGIIHRDINPSNIMIRERDGRYVLLDFGSARPMSLHGTKKLSVYVRRGYAPPEQYSETGEQGPWTDVYGLCASLYFALTGVKPPDALERMASDAIKRPSELGAAVWPHLEETLLQGIAPKVEARVRDMRALYEALYGEPLSLYRAPKPPPSAEQPLTEAPAPPALPEETAKVQRRTDLVRRLMPPIARKAQERLDTLRTLPPGEAQTRCLREAVHYNRIGMAVGVGAAVIIFAWIILIIN